MFHIITTVVLVDNGSKPEYCKCRVYSFDEFGSLQTAHLANKTNLNWQDRFRFGCCVCLNTIKHTNVTPHFTARAGSVQSSALRGYFLQSIYVKQFHSGYTRNNQRIFPFSLCCIARGKQQYWQVSRSIGCLLEWNSTNLVLCRIARQNSSLAKNTARHTLGSQMYHLPCCSGVYADGSTPKSSLFANKSTLYCCGTCGKPLSASAKNYISILLHKRSSMVHFRNFSLVSNLSGWQGLICHFQNFLRWSLLNDIRATSRSWHALKNIL